MIIFSDIYESNILRGYSLLRRCPTIGLHGGEANFSDIETNWLRLKIGPYQKCCPLARSKRPLAKAWLSRQYCCGLKSSRKGCMKKLRKCSQKHWECYRTHYLVTLHHVIAAFPGSLRIERRCESNQEPQNSSQVYLWGDRGTLSPGWEAKWVHWNTLWTKKSQIKLCSLAKGPSPR